MIEELLQNKTAKEKANLKSIEIAKLNFAGTHTDSQTGITVEIKDGKITQIEGGIELYARAFKAGVPLGLGSNGTTEWERFIFINPPVMVMDSAGPIVRISYDSFLKATTTWKLREDPISAIRQTLAHTIKVSASNKLPISGSVGNTVLTAFPDSGDPGAVTFDGISFRTVDNETFSTKRNGAGTGAAGTGASDWIGTRLAAFTNVNTFADMGRSKYGFDTSSIGTGQTISAATFSVYGQTGTSDPFTANSTDRIIYLVSSGGSVTASAASDFENTGTTSFGTFDPGAGLTSWNTAAYNDFTVNATGITNISVSGNTRYGLRGGADFNNSFTSTWSSGGTQSLAGFYADQAGTSQDPKLVVTYSAAVAGYPPTLLFMNAG